MAAAQLKAAVPQQFEQFVVALRAYEKASIVDMVAGDQPHDIFRAQGGVKAIQTLRRHIQECLELREKYQRRDPNAQ